MAKNSKSGRYGNVPRGTSRGTGIKARVDKDSSIEVRQIKNGFIVSESGTKGKGKNKEYYRDEYFSKTNPVKINGSTPTAANIRFGGRKN